MSLSPPDIDVDLLDLPALADVADVTAAPAATPQLRTRGHRRTFKEMLNVANAARSIDRLPDPDEAVHIVMSGNFNAWDIVPAALNLTGQNIDVLAVATLGFSRRNAMELLDLIDRGNVRSVVFVCSCYFRDANPAEFSILADGLQERGQRVAAIRSHAKVIGMRFSDGRTCTTESSANLRSCRNAEQMTMHGSPAVFDFHHGWIQEAAQNGTQAVK